MSDTSARDNMEHYVYMRDNGHLDFIKKHKRCNEFIKNRPWDPEVKAKLDRAGRPALSINKILPGMASVWGEQLANRADVVFRPARGGNQEVAETLSKVWMYTANTNTLPFKESHVFDVATIGSRGYFDLRMGFDDSIFGEVRISTLNPVNVVLDPDADEYDPDTWREVIVTKWLSEDEIGRMYGKQFKAALKGRSKSDAYLGYDFIDYKPGTFGGESMRVNDDAAPHRKRLRVIERQYKKVLRMEHFVDMQSGDTRVIPDGMEREKIKYIMDTYNLGVMKRDTEVIHWVTSVDDITLHDKQSPYKHFTPIPYFPFFIDGEPIGIVEGQLDPQELYNKTTSQVLHVLNTTANSGYKVKTGALQNMTVEDLEERGAETGLVTELNDMDGLEKIQPNQIPSGLDRVAFIAANDLKEASMVSDSMRGFDRADVAAKAIMAKQSQGSTNFAKPLDNLGMTRYFLARNALDLFQTYYTEERVMHITGGDLVAEDEAFTINQVTPEGEVANDLTLGEYSVVVSDIPARKNFEETQFDEAVMLRKDLGIAIPDDVIIEHSHLNRKAEIAKRVRDRNGEGDPTEAQQELQKLEMELKQLEAAKAKAEEQKIQSETALNLVRAQRDSEDKQDDQDGQALSEAELKYREIVEKYDTERYRIDQEMIYKREQLELEREKIQQELILKKAEAAQRVEDAREADKERTEQPKEAKKS